LHLVGEMAAPMFEVPQPTPLQRAWSRLRRGLPQRAA
jgi:hypothetical protein